MNSAAEALDRINDLEQRYPVVSWRAGDIDLWPAYRVRLFMNATLAYLAGAATPRTTAHLAALGARVTRALLKVPAAALRDRRMNAYPRPGTTAVLLSDGLSFTRLQDGWFDRVVDPLIEALQQRGQTALKLTPLPNVHVPRLLPSMLVQPALDRVKLLARWRAVRAELPGFDALYGDAAAAFGVMYTPRRDWLLLQARRIDALAAWFNCLIAKSGARQSFVNNYYSTEGMAFVVASRRAGARSADLQHGLQGDHHVAYGRWAALPGRGYSTLPDEFWVWGRDEAEAIARWQREGRPHAPRISGNLWQERWRDDNDPLVRRYLERARALRAPNAETQVLVNLSWGLADEETDKIVRAARLAGPGIGWWWRLHPVEAHRSAAFAARLRHHGLPADQVTEATELPLFALVRAADVAVAHSSTVMQEAALFGVPSVVTSRYGAELHTALIKSGLALEATGDAAIAAAVRALARRSRARVAPATGAEPLAHLLDGLPSTTA